MILNVLKLLVIAGYIIFKWSRICFNNCINCIYYLENGFSKVKFHVKAHLPDYTTKQIEIIKDTVAAILGCTTAGIFVSGYDHSTSFFVVLSIRQLYLRKLFAMEEQEKEKLTGLNIDYFIVDFITVYINRPNGK